MLQTVLVGCNNFSLEAPIIVELYSWRILHERSCIIEFTKRVVKDIKLEAYRTFYSFFFRNKFNRLNDTGARMLD